MTSEEEIQEIQIPWAAYYAAAREVEQAAGALREALLRQHWAACHIANAFNSIEKRSRGATWWSAQAGKLRAASRRAGVVEQVATRECKEWQKTCKLIGW